MAFVGVDPLGLYPAASLNVGQAARFNFGSSPFIYAPSNGEEPSFRSIAEASIMGRMEQVQNGAHTIHGEDPELLFARPDELLTASSGARRFNGRSGREPSRLGGGCSMEVSSEREADMIDGDSDADIEEGNGTFGIRRSCGGGAEEKEGAGELSGHLELQRQSLVENLIGMGFPIMWAIRAAERSRESKDIF